MQERDEGNDAVQNSIYNRKRQSKVGTVPIHAEFNDVMNESEADKIHCSSSGNRDGTEAKEDNARICSRANSQNTVEAEENGAVVLRSRRVEAGSDVPSRHLHDMMCDEEDVSNSKFDRHRGDGHDLAEAEENGAVLSRSPCMDVWTDGPSRHLRHRMMFLLTHLHIIVVMISMQVKPKEVKLFIVVVVTWRGGVMDRLVIFVTRQV